MEDIIEKILLDLQSFTTPDGRPLYNVHARSGRVSGFSKWGMREAKHELIGTRVSVPSKYGFGYTKTKHPLSTASMLQIKRSFDEWVTGKPWYTRGIGFKVEDDEPFGRLVLTIWIR